MKTLCGMCACVVGSYGFAADVVLLQAVNKHSSAMVEDAVLAAFFAITAIITALCCILIYLARQED